MVGAESYGLYFSLLNFSMILNILLDLGITNFNNKNIAQNHLLMKKHISNIVGIKFLLAGIYAVVCILASLIVYDEIHVHLLIFLILNQFLISFTPLFAVQHQRVAPFPYRQPFISTRSVSNDHHLFSPAIYQYYPSCLPDRMVCLRTIYSLPDCQPYYTCSCVISHRKVNVLFQPTVFCCLSKKELPICFADPADVVL